MRRAPWLPRCAASLFAASCGWSATLQAASVEFNIPAGPATATIGTFARQAGIGIIFPYDLAVDRRTRAVRGRYEPDDALTELLAGSGLAARRDTNGALVIELAAVTRRRSRPPPAAADPANLASEAAVTLSEMVVTGTRLEANGMTTVTPVTAITAADLRLFGPVSLVDALVQLPQFLNNDTPQTQSFGSSGAAGASFLNLRGIGSIRTLTLLDGRRVVPSSRFGTIDLALLPRSLVRRVEVVTGGASAAYGSDAVSGVANVLLDTDFNGFRSALQGGISDLGDNSTGSWQLAYGTRLGDASHLVVAIEGMHSDGIRGYADRSWFSSRAAIGNPDPAGPKEVVVDEVHATGYTYGGLITSGPLAGTQFLPGGLTAPFAAGSYRTSLTQSGGDGSDPAADLVWILPSQTRWSGFAKFATTLDSDIELFGQVMAGYSANSYAKDPPSLWGQWDATIYADNAFLPANVRDALQSQGLGSFRLGRVSTGDLGSPRIDNRSVLLSSTVGFSWERADWKLDGYYQYGRNHNDLHFRDVLRLDRVYRAIDSVVDPASGAIVCRSTLSFPGDGCVPLNLFGAGSPSSAARAYVTEGSVAQLQNVDEHVAELSLQGSPFELPAGAVNTVAGLSWRKEAASSYARRYPAELEGARVVPAAELGYRGLPPSYLNSGVLFERTGETTVAGDYAVREAFAEAAVPLHAGIDGRNALTLHSAVRYAHYSGSGSIAAWKLGTDWQARESLRLRATRSRDIRAGSLAERFDTSTSGVTIKDPLLAGSPSYAVVAQRGANPQIEPETGDTSTIGFVYQPRWAPPFALSADYFDIRIQDAITTLGVQNIIDQCAAGAAIQCELIAREEEAGIIQRVNNRVQNVAQARSRGIDAEATWRSRVTLFGGAESIALRVLANWSFETSTTSAAVGRVDRARQTGVGGGSPPWQFNLSLAYRRDALELAIHEQVISRGIYNVLNAAGDIDDNTIAGVAYTNLRADWRPRGVEGLTLFAHIANVFDRPPPDFGDWGFGGSLPTNESLFDAIGRRFTLGVRLEL